MGRCTQAYFQLHSAHMTSCNIPLGTHHSQHMEPTAHTLDAYTQDLNDSIFSIPCPPARPCPAPACPAQTWVLTSGQIPSQKRALVREYAGHLYPPHDPREAWAWTPRSHVSDPLGAK
jgi:hypothetical protein